MFESHVLLSLLAVVSASDWRVAGEAKLHSSDCPRARRRVRIAVLCCGEQFRRTPLLPGWRWMTWQPLPPS